MCTQGDLVAHRAAEDEQGGFVGCDGGDVGLEGEGRGVFGEDVVEEGGELDGPQHGRCGGRDDVGAEV